MGETEGGKVNEITATKGKLSATIAFDFGGSVEKAIELFGGDVVYANFVRSAVITAQAAMRRLLVTGKKQEEIAAKMASWKPGVPMERVVDPMAAFRNMLAGKTAEERQAIIEELLAS